MGEIKDENGRKERLPLFYDGESVTGKVRIDLQAVVLNVPSLKDKSVSHFGDFFPGQRNPSS